MGRQQDQRRTLEVAFLRQEMGRSKENNCENNEGYLENPSIPTTKRKEAASNPGSQTSPKPAALAFRMVQLEP